MPDGTFPSVMFAGAGEGTCIRYKADGVFRETARARDHGRSGLRGKRFCSACGEIPRSKELWEFSGQSLV